MDRGPASNVLRDVRTLYTLGTLGGLSDAELLERFLARGGDDAEDAFAALVHRHGPTVLGVCRRMLPASHDAEDAFQATFLVLARRAASIGRREKLANWLYGVAVRTAKEARRRAARARGGERRLMDVSRVESEPTEDRDDLLPLLDEELNRLPDRYRAALVACELEGKSRREAAQQLGIPEGTLSTHLARGRKRLRERLLRRGVGLGVGPLAELARPLGESAVPERLMGPTVRAAMGHASVGGTVGTVSQAVSSLAERVLRMMFLTRLTLIVASLLTVAASAMVAVVLGLAALAAAPAPPDPPAPGPDDLPGRVVNKAGAAVAGAQVWALEGPWATPQTVAKATTDGRGRFAVPWIRDRTGSRTFALFVRATDGSIGWGEPGGRRFVEGRGVEIELNAVQDVRGRVIDQEKRPVAGVAVAPVLFGRSAARDSTDYIRLSPELTALFRTSTAADGSFVLKGIPQGAAIQADIAAPALGAPTVSWDTSQAVTIALDGRLGRIEGRLVPPDARGLPRRYSLGLHRAPGPDGAAPAPFDLLIFQGSTADDRGTFRFDGLPPGRYVVNAYFDQGGLIATRPENEVEVGPGAVASFEIPLQRVPMITGRLVDARTGKGVAGVSLQSLLIEREGKNSNLFVAEATTDAQGRYTIPARPGKVLLQLGQVPETHLGLDYGEYPRLEVKADRTWPDLKLPPASALEGIVVDASGRAMAGAEVFPLEAAGRASFRRGESIRTGADGTFRMDRVDPDDVMSLWARAGDATTDGAVVIRPGELKGRLTLTVDPKHAVRIRGMAIDRNGRRIAGARVTLWWDRPYASEKNQRKGMSVGSVLESVTTGDNGWFVLRRLWPGLSYRVVIEARGHSKAEAPEVTGKAGETHDVGKIVLVNTGGHLAGRVVGSDCQPIVGAAVFNRGDGPEPVATSTDAHGRFRIEGLLPGTRYAFVRKEGYRFTGVKADDDTDGLTITLLKSSEPPPAWKPGQTATYDEQRAFARRALIRLWEKYGARNNGAFPCIRAMAEIDPDLAMQWSAEKGHGDDDQVRHTEARKLAETDAEHALGLLNQKPDSQSQSVLQTLADRFAETDPPKALRFAEEAAVQSRGLNQPDRTLAMGLAGAVLVRLGRADAGRRLIDEAARDAAQLPTANRAGYCRGRVARILAPYDLERALALIEPIQNEGTQRTQRFRAEIAVALATTDTKRAIELVDTVRSNAFFHETARTAIAYRIGRDRPDEAIRIIEGMRRDPAAIWQAEAFGWLAVALAPRDRVRANSLIDRALALMIDNQDWAGRSAWSGGEMAGAAHVALRARQIGYPDMRSVIMRVLAARPGEGRNASSERTRLIRAIAVSTVSLALVEPEEARTVLESLESRGGFDPATEWSTREPWLIAWSLVDLRKTQAVFESSLASLDREKEVNLWGTGLFQMVELLTAPPDRREEVLDQRAGGSSWRPGGEL